MSYIIPLVIFIILVVVFRQKAIENANVAKLRNKKAGKAATKRLKKAGILLKAGEPSAFYEEVLKALWGYMGDKLNISVAELNKENVSEKLKARQVPEELISAFIDALNACEFARYAPGDPAQTMDKIYKEAADVLNKMEGAIKR